MGTIRAQSKIEAGAGPGFGFSNRVQSLAQRERGEP
jgi:hypothetical protein